jgi:hypothetical protein
MESCKSAARAFNEAGEVIHIACDQWKCDHCGKVLAWRWAQDINYGINLWKPWLAYFWTLTLPSWVEDAATGYRILPQRWDNFRKRMQRHYGKWHYAAFVEAHPHRNLIPHFHIISLQRAPERLKDMANHAGFGYQAKDVCINGKMAAAYVSKYTTKGGKGVARHFRRVRVSHDWPRLPEPIYEMQVYPPQKGEAIALYLPRVSGILGIPLEVVRTRWLDKSLDIV